MFCQHLRSILFAFFSTSAILLAACQSDEAFHGTEFPDMPFVDFTLTDQHGEPFILSEQSGKVSIIFFGFTFCPDVCPLTLSTWKKVESGLEEEVKNVNFLYITVDPERDTPEQLKNHLANFSDKFIGLSGTEEELKVVYSGFGVYREKNEIAESAAGYLMNHTSIMYLLDKQGIWRGKHSNDAVAEDIVHDLKLLLKR